jgi:hypothetical protein
LTAKTASGGLRIYTGADVGLNRLAGRMNTGASGLKYDRVHRGAVLGQTTNPRFTKVNKENTSQGITTFNLERASLRIPILKACLIKVPELVNKWATFHWANQVPKNALILEKILVPTLTL